MTASIPLNHRLAGAALVFTIVAGACSAGTKSTTATSSSSSSSSSSSTAAAASSSTTAAAAGTTAPGQTTASTACRTGTTTPGGGAGGGDVLVPGDIPDTAKFVTFHSPDGYHIDHPDGWAQSQAGTAVVFTDKFNSIRVELTPAATAPSPSSAQSAEVPALASTVPCFQAGAITQVTRRSGPAVLVTYRADSPQDPVTGKVVVDDVERYEFWMAGRQATITLSSSKGSDNVDPWRKVTDSFAWGA